MKRFDINDYKGKYAMHCKTEEEAREFCDYLHRIERKWKNEYSYLTDMNYNRHQNNTAYAFNDGQYCSVNFYKEDGYTILEFSDFDWTTKFTKADLKTGDVVIRRNGDVEIVNRELEMFIRQNGWNDLDNTREDLMDMLGDDGYDIVAVRRPIKKKDCHFDAFKYQCGTLVYERKEVEEMTLEQVCKLLGKEIKIIK